MPTGHGFDELAKALAAHTSRRAALKQIAWSVLAGVGLVATSRSQAPVAEAAEFVTALRPSAPSVQIRFNQVCFNQIQFNQSIFINSTALPSCDEPPATNDENKPDSKPSQTSEQRHQQERTNKGSEEDERTEGNVVAVNLTGQPPTITIATMDGNVVVELRGDAIALAQYVRVGNYVVVYGEKQHELLFWATDLSIADKK